MLKTIWKLPGLFKILLSKHLIPGIKPGIFQLLLLYKAIAILKLFPVDRILVGALYVCFFVV